MSSRRRRGIVSPCPLAFLIRMPLGQLIVVNQGPLFISAEIEHVASGLLLELVGQVASGHVEKIALVHQFSEHAFHLTIIWANNGEFARSRCWLARQTSAEEARSMRGGGRRGCCAMSRVLSQPTLS